jgi:hypothetical protein
MASSASFISSSPTISTSRGATSTGFSTGSTVISTGSSTGSCTGVSSMGASTGVSGSEAHPASNNISKKSIVFIQGFFINPPIQFYHFKNKTSNIWIICFKTK